MNSIGISASGLRAAGSIVAARAYHDSHADGTVLTKPATTPGVSSAHTPRQPADIEAHVAEVIAATRAIVLGPNR